MMSIVRSLKTEKIVSLSSLHKIEPHHDKTNKMTFAPIRIFAVCIKKHWVLSYPLSALQRLIRAYTQANRSLLLVHRSFCLCVMRRLNVHLRFSIFAHFIELHGAHQANYYI